jgi:hypothetical protein
MKEGVMTDRDISTSREPSAGGTEPSESQERAAQPREEQVPEMSGGGKGSESSGDERTEEAEEK